MDKGSEVKTEEITCKKCGAKLISERQKQRGLCGKCYMEEMQTKSHDNITTKGEVELVGLKIKRGDVLRVVLGRNREIIGQFYAWSPTLCAMTIVTESGYVIVPYKYIKAIFLEGE
jgi:ribosomal protein S27AE/sporulation protein YlmC with PRC-barrel domain